MVKLVEFNDVSLNRNDDLPFDVVDDLHFHMRNDKMFYRKNFLPTVVKIAGDVKEEKGLEKLLDPMLQDAVNDYCGKYKIPKDKRHLFNQEIMAQVKERIMSEDVPAIQKGDQ